MKKLKVLLIFDSPYSVKRGYSFEEEFKDINWATEKFVLKALVANGHKVNLLGLYDDINLLFQEVKENKPDVIFNLVEVFNKKTHLDKNVVGVLELLGVPYTGASLTSIVICGNKALNKQILNFHKIKVPCFHTFYRNHRVWLPKRLKTPLIVKPLREEASRGISQASIVDCYDSLVERVKFIHNNMNRDAIVEEYIDGRELYVSVLGNKKNSVLSFREMKFGELPEDEPRIATYKAKWDLDYRNKWGIKNVYAGRLSNGLSERISEICKRAYRALDMHSYARFDIRVTADSKIFIIESNANPSLDIEDELGQSAERAGITYNKLIQVILELAFKRIT